MLLTETPLENPGPPFPVPPPTPPKPRKDNAKLQRLLRKAAKRSGVQESPTLATKSFRSTLSPVSEADLESTDSAASQRHKKSPSISLPPKFQIKITHRAPSPYPKQKFTFTVSEQHSLSQYLSPSPVPDSSSPFRSSSPNTSFLYPQGGSTSDRLSPGLIAKSNLRPCTPQATETFPKEPLQILTAPAITVYETNGDNAGPLSPRRDKPTNQTQMNGFSISKCEDTALSKGSRSVPDQQVSTYEPKPCSPNSENQSIKPVSTMTTSEISHSRSTNGTRTSIGNQTLTAATDCPDGQSKVTAKTVPVEVNISSKTTATTHVFSSTGNLTNSEMVPKSESMLKPPEKPKPPRKKPGGGWARLVKHLVVEPEEPKFPELQKAEDKTEKSVEETKDSIAGTQQSKANRANKMWDALLYRMATANKEQEKPGSTAPPPLPFFRSRLPLLLHRPRFDARKLKEAASRPLRRVTAFFHRRVAEKATPSTFNRTASGWSIQGEDAKQGHEKQAIDGDTKQ